jgi:glycosyltransferase involved in cell wall biosynthesis
MNWIRIDKYLRTYGIRPVRPLVARSLEGIALVVVIPALAEKTSLFSTLASISANPHKDLQYTLVICVVNNHPYPFTSRAEIEDNLETLKVLEALIWGQPPAQMLHQEIKEDLKAIDESGLRVAFIDASSAGNEIPEGEGGVGTARKIGMDAALGVIDRDANGAIICCLDADTLVQENYLSAVADHYAKTDDHAAVVAYSHQMPPSPDLAAAICCYELFLRYYVLGLSYAESPYAFHSIGSTMTCTAEGYCSVRGMNRRTAAEDFHFLNKLAKIGDMGLIRDTTVNPSARSSTRVPFGTGRRIIRHMSGQTDEYRLYDYRIFKILRKWLALMDANPCRKPTYILEEAYLVHPGLQEYLLDARFETAWTAIQVHSRHPGQLRLQFPIWFDGLKTLKLVHHLSRSTFPMISMFQALNGLLALKGRKVLLESDDQEGIPPIDTQLEILNALRSDFPDS